MSLNGQEDFKGRPSTLQRRCNLVNKIYGEEEGKRKFINTVSKETEEIRKDYIEDNQRGKLQETEHQSMLEDFQL